MRKTKRLLAALTLSNLLRFSCTWLMRTLVVDNTAVKTWKNKQVWDQVNLDDDKPSYNWKSAFLQYLHLGRRGCGFTGFFYKTPNIEAAPQCPNKTNPKFNGNRDTITKSSELNRETFTVQCWCSSGNKWLFQGRCSTVSGNHSSRLSLTQILFNW